MKGGSMTKVLLETIFTKAILEVGYNQQLSVASILMDYERTYRCTYLQTESIATIAQLGSAR
jgi:hypothetical protein